MLQELRHRFACWLAYRQTLESLRQVPDSTLADNGISRQEIREHARHAACVVEDGGGHADDEAFGWPRGTAHRDRHLGGGWRGALR